MKHSLSVALGLSSTIMIGGCAASVPDGCIPSGSDIESVSVSGVFGIPPNVSFEAPLSVESTQRTLILDGEGADVQDGALVLLEFVLYNATTGAVIAESPYQGSSPVSLLIDIDAIGLEGISSTLACTPVGSRVGGLISPSDAVGPDGLPLFEVGAEDSLLFIADVVDAFNPVQGEPTDPPAGFPAVVYGEDGSPTVTIPEGAVPTDYGLATLIEGEGAPVKAGDLVVVHYHGVSWTTGDVFDSSWERGLPTSFSTDGVIPGFRDGLLGQKAGSRVIITIPPELGYGPFDAGNPASGTIVFVVDILGVQ